MKGLSRLRGLANKPAIGSTCPIDYHFGHSIALHVLVATNGCPRMCLLLCHETSDPVCVRFECPANYMLREDADTVLCKEKCTKDICCVRDGEASKAFKVNA